MSVVLIEARGCGFGASGRNGGWAHGWIDGLTGWWECFGPAEGVRLVDRSSWVIDRIEAFCDEHGIDCQLRREGALWTAGIAPAWVGVWDGALQACRAHGRDHALTELDGAELRHRTSPARRCRSRGCARRTRPHCNRRCSCAGCDGSRWSWGCGSTRGRRCARWSADARRSCGRPAGPSRPTASCSRRARGADGCASCGGRRSPWPATSCSRSRSASVMSLPWARGELLRDARLMVHYMQVTPDGRIAFGRGGGALRRRARAGCALP